MTTMTVHWGAPRMIAALGAQARLAVAEAGVPLQVDFNGLAASYADLICQGTAVNGAA